MIRLPGDTRPAARSDSGFMSTLASVPWFMVGLAGIAWERISSTAEGLPMSMRSRRGYRNVPLKVACSTSTVLDDLVCGLFLTADHTVPISYTPMIQSLQAM